MKTVLCDVDTLIHKKGLGDGGAVQQFIDTECLRLCEPLEPKDVGNLTQDARVHTKIGSGQLEYRTPYSRRWYYREARFQGAQERGNYWFERMKQQYKEQILAGAKKIADGGSA